MRLEGKKRVMSRTERKFVLDRKQVLDTLCFALGLDPEKTEFKAQGLLKIELLEVRLEDDILNDCADVVERGDV